MKVDEETGTVTHRTVLKKNKLTRKHKVVDERIEKTKTIDSRFDTRRSPLKWKTFSPRNIGVVYLYGLIWVVFSLWVPNTWLTWLTHRSVMNQNAILVVVALGPAGAARRRGVRPVDRRHDLGVGGDGVVGDGRGGVVGPGGHRLGAAARVHRRQHQRLPGGEDPHRLVHRHARHGVGARRVRRVAFQQPLDPRLPRLVHLARRPQFAWGLNKTVIVALVLAVALWFVLEHTAVGRYLFATGGAREAARLAGVQTDRYLWGSLVTSATFASLGGVLVAMQFGSTQAQSGAPYLLPAFAAAFLGSTQFKKRFNVWGTVFAVLVLQSGVKGLQLAGVGTTWIESLFFGVALIVAVGFSSYRKRVHGGQRRWWRREESGPDQWLGKLLGWGTPKTEQSKANAEEWWFDPEDSEGHHIKPT